MTRTKLVGSILFATLLVTFATTGITLPAFAQQAPTPNPQGQQVSVQQQLQHSQGQPYAAQQQAQQVTPYSSQTSIQSIITQQQPTQQQVLPPVENLENFLNQNAITNTRQNADQFGVQDGLVNVGLQVGNANVSPNVQVAIPVAANICDVSVLAGPDVGQTTCEAQTPGQGQGNQQ
jgi:hypothetical protein